MEEHDEHDDDDDEGDRAIMSWFRTVVALLVRADRSSVRYWAISVLPENFETKYNAQWFLINKMLPEAGAAGASDGVLEFLTQLLVDDQTFLK